MRQDAEHSAGRSPGGGDMAPAPRSLAEPWGCGDEQLGPEGGVLARGRVPAGTAGRDREGLQASARAWAPAASQGTAGSQAGRERGVGGGGGGAAAVGVAGEAVGAVGHGGAERQPRHVGHGHGVPWRQTRHMWVRTGWGGGAAATSTWTNPDPRGRRAGAQPRMLRREAGGRCQLPGRGHLSAVARGGNPTLAPFPRLGWRQSDLLALSGRPRTWESVSYHPTRSRPRPPALPPAQRRRPQGSALALSMRGPLAASSRSALKAPPQKAFLDCSAYTVKP